MKRNFPKKKIDQTNDEIEAGLFRMFSDEMNSYFLLVAI